MVSGSLPKSRHDLLPPDRLSPTPLCVEMTTQRSTYMQGGPRDDEQRSGQLRQGTERNSPLSRNFRWKRAQSHQYNPNSWFCRTGRSLVDPRYWQELMQLSILKSLRDIPKTTPTIRCLLVLASALDIGYRIVANMRDLIVTE